MLINQGQGRMDIGRKPEESCKAKRDRTGGGGGKGRAIQRKEFIIPPRRFAMTFIDDH